MDMYDKIDKILASNTVRECQQVTLLAEGVVVTIVVNCLPPADPEKLAHQLREHLEKTTKVEVCISNRTGVKT